MNLYFTNKTFFYTRYLSFSNIKEFYISSSKIMFRDCNGIHKEFKLNSVFDLQILENDVL